MMIALGISIALRLGMKYVYLIQSLPTPRQRYIGITANLRQRLGQHNTGRSVYTSKYRP